MIKKVNISLPSKIFAERFKWDSECLNIADVLLKLPHVAIRSYLKGGFPMNENFPEGFSSGNAGFKKFEDSMRKATRMQVILNDFVNDLASATLKLYREKELLYETSVWYFNGEFKTLNATI
jgi:hypothetical protein